MRERFAARPMPVEQSIHWKPLRDSHYVVASLHPADGGRRELFIRQDVLTRVDSLARSTHGRHAFGLLVGHSFLCSVTGRNYAIIEALAESPNTLTTDDEIATAVEQSVAAVARNRTSHLLGWYCGIRAVGQRLAPNIAAIHTTNFAEPWQTALVIADAASPPSGAFALYDAADSRWFYAPFYELIDPPPRAGGPKPTRISWPHYMTAETVVFTEPDPPVALRPSVDQQSPAPQAPGSGWASLRALVGKPRPADAEPTTAPPLAAKTAPARTRAVPAQDAVAATSEQRPRHRAPNDRIESPIEKMATVDDAEQRVGAPRGDRVHSVTDDEDTTAGDKPNRFLEIARGEGFFVAGRFHSSVTVPAETIWLLNEPYSGLLLTVVATDRELLDASLHYNVHTEDAELLRRSFPEHQDLASQTLYLRESCLDGLRSKCRRLRATNALEREWNVSPTIYLLTPGEWQSVGTDGDPQVDAIAIQVLNDSRIDALPLPIRQQFRLTVLRRETA